MAGPDPAINCERHMGGGWIYIMTNRPDGTLCIGVTNNLARRVSAHKDGIGSRFTTKYKLKMLVYVEYHEQFQTAIQRETSPKRWPRARKVDLITKHNPGWEDLALVGPLPD